ncbi:beta-glucosidase [Fontibacillus solani]|uniref:beta-glucosidase n=1 Tax=Fontibacillus solani TaxID=1572857 RepID=A0A7W3SXH2_9BACL|nr:beta-glucosidase BglX [Fontibacillus solani]MBA9087928.1 beta-glucosidase [Fontibacillus solani]
MKEEQLLHLLDSMTLEEKIAQLVLLTGEFFDSEERSIGPKQKIGITQDVIDMAGAVYNVFGAEEVVKIQSNYLKKSKKGIPLLILADIIHGYKTVFPIPLGLGSTWNPDLVRKCMEIVADETSASGVQGTFSPMVDLVRDPRWGRVMESTGEDAFLNSVFSAAMVKGFQGERLDTSNRSIASCVKHFAAYGAPEGGREYNTVDMSERRLRQDYLPAYKAAVDSGCEMVMTSFNTVDGVPATGNKWLLRDILKEEWGFEGVVLSDYAATQELILHGVAEDELDAARLAIEAGLDMDMKTSVFANNLLELVNKGTVSESLVDQAALRVLRLKNKLGLFEDPYRGASVEREQVTLLSENNRKMAREAAAQSVVLLKNDKGVLPIQPDKKVALIGPYSDEKMICGMWAIQAEYEAVVTLKEGMKRQTAEASFFHAKGCDILEDYSVLGGMAKYLKTDTNPEEKEVYLSDAMQAAEQSDVIVLALGEHMFQSGEGASRTELSLPEHQLTLLDKLSLLGKPIVLILFTGRPLVLTGLVNKVASIVQAWYPGTETGNALAELLYGKRNFSGKLSISFPHSVGQIPVYYNEFSTGRPLSVSGRSERFVSKYLDAPNAPLFPFGYGLSYTNFEYSDLRLSHPSFSYGDTIQLSVDVTNTGEMSGAEIVQLYIRDVTGSVVRPVKELKGFQKVNIEPGETLTVLFIITEELLRFYTLEMEYKAEPGKFIAMIGTSSDSLLETEFTLLP